MRDRLSALYDRAETNWCWNFGLAYERLLMFPGRDPNDAQAKNDWLKRLEETAISPAYGAFLLRWRSCLDQPCTRTQICRSASRMFVGHGNPSGSEVGLTVHHTWGVPVIPGSSLKGLLAHYVATHYGARPGDEDPERERWRGVTWDEKRVVRGPGELYRLVFGAPDADMDEGEGTGACAGAVTFHDALYLPSPQVPDRPFVRDVLTVHQKSYYDSQGGTAPSDYDNPNPVGFVNVGPGAMFLIALSGPEDWVELLMSLLIDALDDWGVGGKTSLGYGRLLPVDDEAPSGVDNGNERVEAREPSHGGPSRLLVAFRGALRGETGARVPKTLALLVAEWPERLLELDDKERRLAANAIKKRLRALKKGRDDDLASRLRAWIDQLRGG